MALVILTPYILNGRNDMEILEYIFIYIIAPMIVGFIGAIIVGTLKNK